jgi:hypothetical protein
MTLSTGGFRQVVAFPPAPIATGWSDPCREGLAPSQEPCLSTAHDFMALRPPGRWVGGVQIGAGMPDWRWNDKIEDAVCLSS